MAQCRSHRYRTRWVRINGVPEGHERASSMSSLRTNARPLSNSPRLPPDDPLHGDEEQASGSGDASILALAAAQLRQGAKDVELNEAPTMADTTTLPAWGYFNPFGPTANWIDALPVGNTGELLLVRASDHESSPDYRAFALIPPGVDLASAVREVLIDAFAVNGRGDEWVFVGGGLPSYVHLFPESPVDHACASELFRSAAEAASGLFGWSLDYGQEIQDLTHAWRDPWGQATAAVNRVLQGLAAKRLIAQIQDLEAGGSQSVAADDENNEAGPADDALFDLWFALAAQPAYVECIEGQMGTAWQERERFEPGHSSDRRSWLRLS
jgi:hypothetical protein